MKTYMDCVQSQAKRMFDKAMGGYFDNSVDNTMIAFIFEMEEKRVNADVQRAFRILEQKHYEKYSRGNK